MNKIKKLYLQNPIFKFMISYSFILLIPLLICLIGYNVAFNTVEKEIKDNSLSMLKHTKSIIDGQISSLNTLVMQIATHPMIVSMADTTDTRDKTFYYDAPKAINGIADLMRHSSINIIEDIYIFLGNTDYIITPKTLYEAGFYYYNILEKSIEDFEGWKNSLLREFKYNKYMIDNKEVNYIQSIPLRYDTPVNGAVICELNEQAIEDFFSEVQDSYIYIQDQEGNLIWQSCDEQTDIKLLNIESTLQTEGVFSAEMKNQKMLGMYTISTINDWRYTLLLPERVVMKELSNLRALVFLIFIATLIIGILISYYMSLKYGKPLIEIIKNLKGSDIDMSEESLGNIDNLGGAITKIVSKTQMLKDELERQQPLLQTAFFQKLILGEFTTEQELHLLAGQARVAIQARDLYVVTCRVFANNEFYSMDTQTLEEVNVAIILIKNTLKELFTDRVHFYEIDHLTTVMIVEHQANHVEKKIKEANAYLVANYHMTPSWGISNKCTSWLEIWRAYEQAKKALLSGIKEGIKNIMHYNEVIEGGTTYYYPLAFEQRLIGYTKNSDTQSIKHLFEILFIENIEKRNLSDETLEQFYAELDSTVIKLTNPEESEEYLKDLRNSRQTMGRSSRQSYFELWGNTYIEICQCYKKDKTNRQRKLINKIIEYIDECYADSNLGLGMVASQFNISEGYISSLFKEQTGINFTEYVENLRINKACNLLKDTELNINDIGEQVGYNSVQSFRRAFKRIHGISPSELRKKR
ncbi:MAG: AraC family transcriptional regulator [Cellulosilyticaceae bacterium]